MQTYDFSKPGSSAKIEKLLDSQMKKIFEAKVLESKNIDVPEFNVDDAQKKLESIFSCKPNI